jgi:hypothetical protein
MSLAGRAIRAGAHFSFARTKEKQSQKESSPENVPEAKNQKIWTKSEKRTRLRLA